MLLLVVFISLCFASLFLIRRLYLVSLFLFFDCCNESKGDRRTPWSDMTFSKGPISSVDNSKLAMELALEFDCVEIVRLEGSFRTDRPDLFTVTGDSGIAYSTERR